MDDFTSFVDLTDSDMLVLDELKLWLNDESFRPHDYDAFQREIKERFYNAGFRIEVKVYETNYPGVLWFDPEIHERLAGEIDPDQMVYEVTKDILDLGEGGVISTDGVIK